MRMDWNSPYSILGSRDEFVVDGKEPLTESWNLTCLENMEEISKQFAYRSFNRGWGLRQRPSVSQTKLWAARWDADRPWSTRRALTHFFDVSEKPVWHLRLSKDWLELWLDSRRSQRRERLVFQRERERETLYFFPISWKNLKDFQSNLNWQTYNF